MPWSKIVPPLTLEILSPTDGTATSTAVLEVSGTVSGSRPSVTVNGVAATVANGSWSILVPLAEGANQLIAEATGGAGLTASDSVTIHLDSTPPLVTVTAPLDGVTVAQPAIDVSGTLDESVPVEVNGIAAQVDGLSFTVSVPLSEGANLLTATAIDTLGNEGTDAVTVSRDTLGPEVTILAPIDGSVTDQSTIEISGTIAEAVPVMVNGLPATIDGSTFTATLTLADGPNVIIAQASDALGNLGSDSVAVVLDTVPPAVTIESPVGGTVTAAETIEVTGSAQGGATVTVNGIPATASGTSYSATVLLDEGSNVLVALASGPGAESATASVQVVRDTEPPLVTVLSPQQGAVLSGSLPLTTTVTGTIHDAASGLVNANDCVVTVNGIHAQVENGGWVAFDVPVAVGESTITVTAADSVGNSISTTRAVVGNVLATPHLEVVSGNGQNAETGQALAAPLVVRAVDGTGGSLAGVDVTFQVTRGDGGLGGGERTRVVTTDGGGEASVQLTLGSRSGAASDSVEAAAEGFFGTAAFCASARVPAAAERRLAPVTGSNQRGTPGTTAAELLTVLVTDVHGNPVAGDTVTFEVLEGGGLVDGSTEAEVPTNDDGRAVATFTFGAVPGVGRQRIAARLDSVDPVTFAASSIVAGDPAATSVSGVVLTLENDPIAGVTVRLADLEPPVSVLTDDAGTFKLAGVPPGRAHLEVDGGTAGSYPTLELEIDLVAGVDNPLPRPARLPLLDEDGKALANLRTDVEITRDDLPGFRLTIPAGAATFADASRQGEVQVVTVNLDAIPMAPEDGTLPSLPFSVQPSGVRFDPPAPLRLPNADGRPPGAVITLHSFDHDLGKFVPISTMKVSEDGAFLTSEPGQGIVKGGWHYASPVPPERRMTLSTPALIRCQDANTCNQCTITGINGKDVCTCQGLYPRSAIDTPDFDCLLFPDPQNPGNDANFPCDLVRDPSHWTNNRLTPNPNSPIFPLSGDPFKTSGSLCTRLYEMQPSFTGVAPGTAFRCRFPVDDNPNNLPICCPETHWDGRGCLSDGPFCTPGTDSDSDGLDDCAETDTGVFRDPTDAGTDPNNPDTDGDGLSDGDEVLGAGLLDLPGMGVNPLRKNILLEYDWFDDNLDPGTCPAHSHRPTSAALDRVSTAFMNAPVNNPDGTTGITVIHDYGQGGPFIGGNRIADPDGVIAGGVNDPEFQAHKLANFAPERMGYFHYVLLPHRYDTNSGSSGQAELPGNDSIVSLYCFGTDRNVAHTIMHELGHNLSLRHGGFEHCNYKPNYNSVMNYRYQFLGVDDDCTATGDGTLDYSRGDRLSLDERNLDETQGVCGAPGIDWNNNGMPENAVVQDLNHLDIFQIFTCGGSLTTLLDNDDWHLLFFGGLADGDGAPPVLEIIDCENPPGPP